MELVLLLDRLGNKYLVKPGRGKLNTSLGLVDLEQLREVSFGQTVKSHLGEEFHVLPVSLKDLFDKGLRRGPQVVLPKDAAQILAYADLRPGSRVVDCGTGSGWLAIFLGSLVRPTGKVYTYEIRDEFFRLARENIRRAGLEDVIVLKKKDVYKGIDEREVDLVTVDVPEPWKVVPHAEDALKVGGYLAVFSPCVESVQETYRALSPRRFSEVVTIECLVRELLVRPGATRPSNEMVAHTSYLTFARRI